ncbi:hypothetical protein TNCT_651971 [Trichonephila clavata]|uniref:Uncharacterized protein n=1 Tax=Trichonephila clavata TaxID=2740835 RepID=A0A8X6KP55_TRICU|nr:hypothetical protein TNCT_651971 [Trichonephila clavata]
MNDLFTLWGCISMDTETIYIYTIFKTLAVEWSHSRVYVELSAANCIDQTGTCKFWLQWMMPGNYCRNAGVEMLRSLNAKQDRMIIQVQITRRHDLLLTTSSIPSVLPSPMPCHLALVELR